MPTKRENAGKKATAEKPSLITIIADIPMGTVELSETKAISVSLVRNALQQDYVAICRMQRSKNNDEWKPRNAIWLPFSNMDKIIEIINYAYKEGLKLGWGNTYQSKPLIYRLNNDESATNEPKKELAPLELTPDNAQSCLKLDRSYQ